MTKPKRHFAELEKCTKCKCYERIRKDKCPRCEERKLRKRIRELEKELKTVCDDACYDEL